MTESEKSSTAGDAQLAPTTSSTENAPTPCESENDPNASSEQRGNSEDAVLPSVPDPKLLTGIGRPIFKDEKWVIVDEADWDDLPPKEKGDGFVLTIYPRDGTLKAIATIWSKYLCKIFRSQLSYAPDIIFDVESITIEEPYAALYYHLDRLAEFVQCDDDPEAKPDDFKSLQLFYEKWVRPGHEEVRSSLQTSHVRFENLWAVFEPGQLLYTLDEFEQPQLYLIGASTFRGTGNGQNQLGDVMQMMTKKRAPRGRFCLDGVAIKWDASTRLFERRVTTLTITDYKGTRLVTSLPFYPLQYYGDGDKTKQAELLKGLERRGLDWKDYMSGKPSCRQHAGPAREYGKGPLNVKPAKERTKLNARVVVDNEGAREPVNEVPQSLTDLFDPLLSTMTSPEEPLVQQAIFSDKYVFLDAHPADEPFSPLQAHLSPSLANCFDLMQQKWYQISIANLSPVQWAREAYDHLVLNQDSKDIIRGLLERHRKNQDVVLSDVISGKGMGLVVVLHGPPGVGKTLTAESVAEYTQKPLFQINIGELTMEATVVPKLQEIFNKASRWDAVLLLDEADVVLEQRSFEDMKRNGIVSVFLRMLEYYEGILFMTTNRPTTIDPAFQSRIHIALRFKQFDPPTRRKVWINFIDRLDNAETRAKEEMMDRLDDLASWELNGRQIRNVIMIAQSLALGNARRRGAMRFEHVEKVANETIAIQEFLDLNGRDSKSRLAEVADRGWPKSQQPIIRRR